jgi:hypothetical protein
LAVDIKNKAISQPRRASIWCVGPPTLGMSGGIAAIAGTQKKAWRPPTPGAASRLHCPAKHFFCYANGCYAAATIGCWKRSWWLHMHGPECSKIRLATHFWGDAFSGPDYSYNGRRIELWVTKSRMSAYRCCSTHQI